MTTLVQGDLKGTYEQAAVHTKQLVSKEQKDNLDRFLSQDKTYFEQATTPVLDEELQGVTGAEVKLPIAKKFTLAKEKVEDATIVIKNDTTPLVKDTDYKLETNGDETSITLLQEITVVQGKKLTVNYTHETTPDKTLKEATETIIQQQATGMYQAYIVLLKGDDGERGTDDLDISTLDAADQQGLQEILELLYKHRGEGVINALIKERISAAMFAVPEVPADPDATWTAPTYELSTNQTTDKNLSEARTKDMQNESFFKMMYGDVSAYDATIVVDMMQLPEIEKNAITASGVDLAAKLTKAEVEVNAEYGTEKTNRATNIEAILALDTVSEYGYGIGETTDVEGENTLPLHNFEALYKEAMGLAEDAEVDFDTLFKADVADANKFEAIVKIKEFIKEDLDTIYHETEYTTKLDARETAMGTQIENLQKEKFYHLKLEATDKIVALIPLDKSTRMKEDNIEKSALDLLFSEWILSIAAYDGTNEASEKTRERLNAVLEIGTIEALQQLIYEGLDDEARKTALENDRVDGKRNGQLSLVTIKEIAWFFAGEEKISDVTSLTNALNAFYLDFENVTEIPPQDCLDAGGNLDTTMREKFKKTMNIYKTRDIDLNITRVSELKYNNDQNGTFSDFNDMLSHHQGKVVLERLNPIYNDTEALATNTGDVSLLGMGGYDISKLSASLSITNLSINDNSFSDGQWGQLAYKTHGTLFLDDLNFITKTQIEKFGPQSTALLSMMGLKDLDGGVAKHLAETEKKILLQPDIQLEEYKGIVAEVSNETLAKNEEAEQVVFERNTSYTLGKEDVTGNIVVKNGNTALATDKYKVEGNTITLLESIIVAANTNLTVDYSYQAEPACTYRYDTENQIIVKENKQVVQDSGVTGVDATATTASNTTIEVTDVIKIKGNEILEKVEDTTIQNRNKNNQTSKFNEVIAIVDASTDIKKDDLEVLLNAGNLTGFQTKIGANPDGKFGAKTLEKTQRYLLGTSIDASTSSIITEEIEIDTNNTIQLSDGFFPGMYYVGNIDGNGKATGLGKVYEDAANTKIIYDGNLKDNEPDGKGTYTTKKGATIEGERENGLLIKVRKTNGVLEFNPGLDKGALDKIEKDDKEEQLQALFKGQNQSSDDIAEVIITKGR